jgi:hypothetical protein
MLTRPSSRRRPRPTPEDRRRERRRLEQIRYRERSSKGIVIVRVPIDGEVMNWLLRLGYCDEHDLDDLDQLGTKIGQALSASAKN